MMTKKALIFVVVGALSVAMGTPPGASAQPSHKHKTHVVEGLIAGAGGLVTQSDFILSCPSLPLTQGVDAYVVEVPPQFAKGDSVASISGSYVGLTSWQLRAYGRNCASIGDKYLEPPVLIPKDAGFILVHHFFAAASSFELTLTRHGHSLVIPPPTKPFRAQGSFAVGGPIPITHFEFIFSCPQMPRSQGLDGYVVAIPPEYSAHGGMLDLTYTQASELQDLGLRVSFYSRWCEQGNLFVTPPTDIPIETGFIVVTRPNDGAALTEFELTIKPMQPVELRS